MKSNLIVKFSLLTSLAFGLGLATPYAAEANKSGALAASITRRTFADRSTVVGKTKDGKHSYVRSEHSIDGRYNRGPNSHLSKTKTRLVNNKTGKIKSTSADHQPAARAATLAHETSNGATGPFWFSVKSYRGSMTKKGNIETHVTRNTTAPVARSFQGQTQKRLVVLNKTGSIKKVQDAPNSGN